MFCTLYQKTNHIATLLIAQAKITSHQLNINTIAPNSTSHNSFCYSKQQNCHLMLPFCAQYSFTNLPCCVKIVVSKNLLLGVPL